MWLEGEDLGGRVVVEVKKRAVSDHMGPQDSD